MTNVAEFKHEEHFPLWMTDDAYVYVALVSNFIFGVESPAKLNKSEFDEMHTEQRHQLDHRNRACSEGEQ